MASDVQALAIEALAALRSQADADRARFMLRYAPTAQEHVGATVPQARREAARIARALRGEPADAVIAAAEALLLLGTFDTRCAAAYLLGRRRDVLRNLSVRDIERLAEGNDNWANVDAFATEVAGLAWRDGPVADADVRRWASSGNVWTRRMALVATTALNKQGRSDAARTLDICERLADDEQPYVRKALSWALRALAVPEPSAVATYLAAHPELPRSVRREVETKLRTGRKTAPRRAVADLTRE